MLKGKPFLVVAAIAVMTAGCQAPPTWNDVASDGPLLGGQTLGSGHRSDGDSSGSAEATSSSGETDTRSGNLFGSGT